MFFWDRVLKICLVLSLAAIGAYSAKSYWEKKKPVPLYPVKLSFENFQQIKQGLSDSGIWFESHNLTLMVRREDKMKAQVFLATKGIPKPPKVHFHPDGGLEFDESEKRRPASRKPTIEDQQAARIRKNILAFFRFDDAWVHLVPPRKSYFPEYDIPYHRAVVRLQLAPGTTLSPELLQAVVDAAVSEVPSLKAEHVEISDVDRNRLFPLETAKEEP